MSDFIQTALMDSPEGRSFVLGSIEPTVPVVPQVLNPTYSVSLVANTVMEGEVLVATVTTTDVSNSTKLFFTLSGVGSAVMDDLIGSIWVSTVYDNKATVRIPVKIDALVESGETVVLQVRTLRTTGPVVATAAVVNIVDRPVPAEPPALPTRTRVLTAGPVIPTVPSSGTPSYTISVSPLGLCEFKVNKLEIFTINVPDSTQLFVTLNEAGTASYSDFIGFPLSTTVANNNASRSVYSVSDGLTETETAQFDLRTGSTTGPVVATTGLLTLLDPANPGGGTGEEENPPTYSISVAPQIVLEGQALTITISTTEVPDNTVMFIAVDAFSSAGSNDVVGSPWQINIVGNTATLVVNTATDSLEESAETIRFLLKTGSASGRTLATSNAATITNIAVVPSYSVTLSSVSVNEGGTFTGTVATTGVPNGTRLYATVHDNATTTSADFDGAPYSITINNNTGTFTGKVKADKLTEGSEIVTFDIRLGSSSGAVVSSSPTLIINDTSLTPAISYNLVATPNTANENAVINVAVTTTGVPNGTVLYGGINNAGTANTADFTNSQWTVTINNNAGNFAANVLPDLLTEGSETVQFVLRTVSQSGSVVATSNMVTISDTSTGSGGSTGYGLVISPSSVSEGGSITMTVTTTNTPNGTVLYITPDGIGTASASDFTGLPWSVVINNNTGTVSANIYDDTDIEDQETKRFQLRTISSTGPVVATSNTLIISASDNGGGGTTPTYQLVLDPSVIDEGQLLHMTAVTTNVPANTLLYITTANTTDLATSSWTVSANNTVFGVISTDQLTEGEETVTLYLRTGSTSGAVVAQATLTINDTSTGSGGGVNNTSVLSYESGDSVAMNSPGVAASAVYSISPPISLATTAYATITIKEKTIDNLNPQNDSGVPSGACSYRVRYGTVWGNWTNVTHYGAYDGENLLIAVNMGATGIEVRKETQPLLTNTHHFHFEAYPSLDTDGWVVPYTIVSHDVTIV